MIKKEEIERIISSRVEIPETGPVSRFSTN